MSGKPQLQKYRSNVHSASGEDGLIAEIMRRLGISRGWFCEFGAFDGKHASNCYRLLRRGWSGVMIEGDPAHYRRLEQRAIRFPGQLYAIQRYVSHVQGHPDSLDSILFETPIPQDFEVLSIDIDGYDYQVWKSLNAHRPILVIIEVDSAMPPGVMSVYGEGGGSATSFSSMLELGRSKGYELVAHTGNMFFVRCDKAKFMHTCVEAAAHPELLFSPEWLRARSAREEFFWKLRLMSWERVGVKLEELFFGKQA
jgi:hypothetical protein